MDMKCRSCEKTLASANELFFFVKSSNEVQLLIKPECRAVLENNVFLLVPEAKKKMRVKCKKCFENIGWELPYGPNGISFLAFGTEKVIFLGEKLSSKQKWRNVMTRYLSIEKRNMENFFGRTLKRETYEQVRGGSKKGCKEMIRFPSVETDYEWYSLTLRKLPRNYQIDAYIEALQQDLVVVMDTGLGKTLIASMVIAKMKILNPNRMGLMLVDRIPLVFQQGQAIANDTGLRVCRLCSENRTSRHVRQLHDGTYDVLVITAGSFNELISREKIEISNFSVIVFDECHHATGDHIYRKVLQHLEACSPNTRPRVLGLTASPFKAQNIIKGRNQLEKFRRCFVNAAFFYPDIPRLKNVAIEVKVERNIEQSRFICNVMRIIQQTIRKIGNFVRGFSTEADIKESQLNLLKGQVKAIREVYPDNRNLMTLVTDVLLLIETIEVCELLGVSQSIEVLTKNRDLSLEIQQLTRFKNSASVAPRLLKLEKLLNECSSETKAIVFVRTQISAIRLFEHLEENFPDMNPGIILGHGGYFGMNWEDEQKPVLRDFRDGKTRLILATSVLEEGLDVAECDLVIRYTGPNTLINFIQSRGRARRQDSKFYVFIDEQQAQTAADLECQESILRHLIKVEGSRDCLPSEWSKQIKATIESGRPNQTVMVPQVQPEGDVSRMFVVEFYLRTTEDEALLSDALVCEIEQYDTFKVHRLLPIEKGAELASGTSRVFTCEDKAFLTSLSSELDDVEHAYEEFCKQWDFEMTSLPRRCKVTHAWCKYVSKKPSLSEVQRIWNPISVEFGNFTSKQIFECSLIERSKIICQEMEVMMEENLRLEFDQKGITLEKLVGETTFIMYIPLTSLHEFAVCCASMDGQTLHLYLPLKTPPNVGTENRNIKDAVVDNKVVCITFPSSSWKELRRTLAVPEIMPVSVFNTCVKHEHAFEYAQSVKIKEATLEGYQVLNNSLWLMKVLKGKREFCLPNRNLLFLYEKLVEALVGGYTDLWETALNYVIQNENCFWIDLETAFIRVLDSLQTLPKPAILLAKVPVPAFHKMIKRVVITPNRLVCLPATPVAESRLLRYYGDEYEFLIVSFRAEEFQELHSVEDKELLRRIKNFIINGFTAVKHYWFFCSSASQLRDRKAYFVAAQSYDEVQKLRSKIVLNRSEQKSTAKYLSKLGLFCTSDKQILSLSEERMAIRDDIRALNGDLVTDGCDDFLDAKRCNQIMSNKTQNPEYRIWNTESRIQIRILEYGIRNIENGIKNPIRKERTPDSRFRIPCFKGKVSRKMAQKISSLLQLEDHVPSAFQIRVGGIKGVLAVASDNDPELRHSDVIYRESMLKFVNNDKELCVVNCANYHKLFLNREVITLLTSINELLHRTTDGNIWMIEHTIRVLHEKALWDAARIFEDSVAAREALMQFLPKQTVLQVQNSGFDVLTEPFWFALLRNAYSLSVMSLRRKSRILLDNGCLLMGIADTIGLLKDNEVFVQFQEDPIKSPRIITGPVLIYRNPCLHPGDLRWVTAVNHPNYLPWKNVLILPTEGVSNSLAADCSGGDLDGDLFAVIWDERFIPPCPVRNPPLNYAELSRGAPENFVPDKERLLFADVFCLIVQNHALGQVANRHLALCDQLPKGACDDLAKELAKSQSQAVDFPKTGILPTIPREALGIKFPDFMEKDSGYYSEKVIGELYRRCRSSVFDFELAIEKGRSCQSSFDLDLFVDGYEEYIEDAKEGFEAYKRCMQGIMAHYSLKRESEVVLGRPLSWDPLLKADKGKVMEAIEGSYEAVKRKFRAEFLRNVSTQEEQRKKAYAWYAVAYDRRNSMASKNFFSFAWLVHDILCTIKQDNTTATILKQDMVLRLIDESIYSRFFQCKSRLESMIATKENILRCVKAEIDRVAGKNCFAVEAYGSASMYLCSEESDLDVCLTPLKLAWEMWAPADLVSFKKLQPKDQAKHFLEIIISKAVDNISNSKVHKLKATVPVITITVGDQNRECAVDLSFNNIGLAKTLFMHRLYTSNCKTFILLWVLVRWARAVGMIKSGMEAQDLPQQPELRREEKTVNVEGLLATAEFYVLVIHLLDLKPTEEEFENKKERNKKAKKVCPLKRLFVQAKEAKKDEEHQVAHMLVTFFRRGALMEKCEEDVELVWPDENIPNVILSAQVIKLISLYCMNGLHSVFATRSVSTMLSQVKATSEKEVTFSRKLPKCLVHAFGKATEFHAARLSSVTGANVKISMENIVFATGSRSSIMKLKEELHALSVTNRALMLGRLPKKTSRYFMEGSTLVIAKGNPSADAMVLFGKSVGPWNMLHHLGERHHPTLKSEPVHDWIGNAVSRFSERLMQQLCKLPLKNQTVIDSLSTSITFGSFYTVNISQSLPPTQTTLSVDELGIKIEKGRRNRKNWQRGEFVAEPEPNRFFAKARLGPAKGDLAVEKKKPKHRDTKKSSITSSFCSGILAQNNHDKAVLQLCEEAFISSLAECGFALGTNGFDRSEVGWKVHSLPSSSYEVVISLDQEMKNKAVEERALKWISANVVDGDGSEAVKGLLANHDIRINIISRDSVPENSDLWKKVVPEPDIPILELKEGEPVVHSAYPQKSKSFFTLIRHVSSCRTYFKENFDSYIVRGTDYSGKDFKIRRTFCDIGLKYNPERLRSVIRNGIEAEDCRAFAEELFTAALQISDALNKKVNCQ
ncbi:uncharacterized protein LOC135688892 isoform X1 [Rhopilema esculentum]|uniref:uncharacterized protein LOC135688892 isoform X1 n=1 Tax=Rhopilema esculentum TaxID=499914 RepID=UPI0031E1B4C7